MNSPDEALILHVGAGQGRSPTPQRVRTGLAPSLYTTPSPFFLGSPRKHFPWQLIHVLHHESASASKPQASIPQEGCNHPIHTGPHIVRPLPPLHALWSPSIHLGLRLSSCAYSLSMQGAGRKVAVPRRGGRGSTAPIFPPDGQAGRGRAQGGERPMGTAADGGKGFKGRAAVSGERPIGAASCRQQHNRASCQTPTKTMGQGAA